MAALFGPQLIDGVFQKRCVGLSPTAMRARCFAYVGSSLKPWPRAAMCRSARCTSGLNVPGTCTCRSVEGVEGAVSGSASKERDQTWCVGGLECGTCPACVPARVRECGGHSFVG
eukprot:289684-Chlamydomonas_euryale.AAC.1